MILPFAVHEIPVAGQNSFGSIRKHDIHTGVDLFCAEGQQVYAMESGVIVNIIPFTGTNADSPWWNNTEAVMIGGNSGVILYGEITPITNLKIGDYVEEGEYIGNVVRVLKNDKGKPTTMLHLELYTLGTIEPVWWKLNQEKPSNLLDPTDMLFSLTYR